MDGWVDGWVDGLTGGWMYKCMQGWMGGCVDARRARVTMIPRHPANADRSEGEGSFKKP
jgi:hypothetical protein